MDDTRLNKALFLDRDGTINVDKGYIYKPEDFVFLDGIVNAIKKYSQSGYLIIVITNQSGIARGYYTEYDLLALHEYIDALLLKENARIDKWYYCPHHPEAGIGLYRVDCNCRKPKTGMIEQAVAEFDIDVSQSLLVGDSPRDLECGEKMGIRSLYIDEFLTQFWHSIDVTK